MYKSKVLQIISKFNAQEQLMLKSFVEDKNFNTHPKVTALYQLIYDHKNELTTLDKKWVYQKIFKASKYNDLALRHLLSYLLKVVENFGIIYKNKKTILEKQFEVVNFYNAIDYEKGITQTIHEYQNELKKDRVLNTEEIYAKYLLDSFNYNYAIKNKRTDVSHLISLNKSLDEFFILSKLKVACNIANQQNIFNQSIDSGFFKDLMEYVNKQYLSNKLISLYFHIYKLISNNDELEYQLSVNSFDDCISINNKNDLRDALVLLINFCIKKINQGNVAYEIAVFNHYKVGIENKILLDRNLLSPFTYSNTLNIAIKQNDLNWAEAFLENYKQVLDTEYPDDYYLLNRAKLLVAKKQFNEALDFVNKAEINDILSQLQLRIVQLKIVIELNEYRLAESYIGNLKQLLKRKEIINYHKTNFNKIAGYMLKLIKIAPYSKAGKTKLINDIKNEPVLSEKSWLLEKLNIL